MATACTPLPPGVECAAVTKTDPLGGRQTPGSATRDQGPPPSKRRAAVQAAATAHPPADQYGRCPARDHRSTQPQARIQRAQWVAAALADQSGSSPTGATATAPAENGRPPQRRARGSTDQRNSARAVPACLATGEQGANRMTGVYTRDSAQRRPIASIGRMRVTFLHIVQCLLPSRRGPAWPTTRRYSPPLASLADTL